MSDEIYSNLYNPNQNPNDLSLDDQKYSPIHVTPNSNIKSENFLAKRYYPKGHKNQVDEWEAIFQHREEALKREDNEKYI